MTTWHPIDPLPVWILRPGVVPLPAWSGILIGWQHLDGKPPGLHSWKGLVAFSRLRGTPPELGWFFPADLRKVAEEPPICGFGHYPESGPWSLK